MASAPAVLILGAGPRVGSSVAERFASDGYKVAVTSRSGKGTDKVTGILSLQADFTKPDSIPALFDAVKNEFGSFPSVVIYNAAALTPPTKEVALSIPADSFAKDFNVNTVSPYVAAQQAVSGWETLPQESKKVFIYTGNFQNESIDPRPVMMNLGMGKSATAYWIGLADQTYSARGFRFFYADQRQPDGTLVGTALDGPAHGDFYAQLARGEQNVPWHATFAKGKGYIKLE